jgi:hypothetical protein
MTNGPNKSDLPTPPKELSECEKPPSLHQESRSGRLLVRRMQGSPLHDVDLERAVSIAPVREVDL